MEDCCNSDKLVTSSQDGDNDKLSIVKGRTISGLLARLKSYASLPWSTKPIEVSPLVCARHGWLCREPDSLMCPVCGAAVSARLPAAQSAENYGQLLADMLSNLARCHLDDCPWQSDPMPDDTPLLPFTDPESDLQAFLRISESLAPISAAVNSNVKFTIQCPVVRDLTEFVLSRSDRLQALPEEIRLRCFLLAVAGWLPTVEEALQNSSLDASLETSEAQQSLGAPDKASRRQFLCCCCAFCQRRVGLWSLNQPTACAAAQQMTGGAAAATVVVDDASLSDGMEAGMSLGGVGSVSGSVGGGGGGGMMPAPSYALTEMIINRQLLFAKRQHSVSDWSLISNAGSEAASIRDLEDVQSVAGSTISNVSAGELAGQLQEFEQQQQPASSLSLLNLPPGQQLLQASLSSAASASDADNWSTVTNADSDLRSIATQSEDQQSAALFGLADDCVAGSGGKRPRLDDSSQAAISSASSTTGGGLPPVVVVDLLTLHWPWCPWRPGDPSEDWCRSVLCHADLGRQADVYELERERQASPPTPTPAAAAHSSVSSSVSS